MNRFQIVPELKDGFEPEGLSRDPRLAGAPGFGEHRLLRTSASDAFAVVQLGTPS